MPTPKKLLPTDVYLIAYPGWQDRADGLIPLRGAPSTVPEGCRLFKVRVPIPIFGGSEVAEPLSADIEEIEAGRPGVIAEQIAADGAEGGIGVVG